MLALGNTGMLIPYGAKRAKEFLEKVIYGLQIVAQKELGRTWVRESGACIFVSSRLLFGVRSCRLPIIRFANKNRAFRAFGSRIAAAPSFARDSWLSCERYANNHT